MLAALAAVAGALLYDAYGCLARSNLKAIAARVAKAGVPAPAAADEAAGAAALAVNVVYVLVFGALATHVLPNFQQLLGGSWGAGAAAAAMLLPAGGLFAHGRKWI